MDNDNINDYMPSILNPRVIKKQHDFSLTQNSVISRCSLSLRRPKILTFVNKTNANNIENSSVLQNVTQEVKKVHKDTLVHELAADNGSLDLSFLDDLKFTQEPQKTLKETQKHTNDLKEGKQIAEDDSLGVSLLKDIISDKHESTAPTCDLDFIEKDVSDRNKLEFIDEEVIELKDNISLPDIKSNTSYSSNSSENEQEHVETQSVSTLIYSIGAKRTIRVSFGVNESKYVNVDAQNGAISKFCISHNDNNTDVHCDLIEKSSVSTETELDENINAASVSPQKRRAVTVSLRIKKKKMTHIDSVENSQVLILNTNAIEKISYVIVQPPNYKFVKRNISHKSKYKNNRSIRNGNANSLKQVTIESFCRRGTDATIDVSKQLGTVDNDASKEMSKNLGVIDAVKCDRLKSARPRKDLEVSKSPRRDSNDSPVSARLPSKKDVKTSNSATPPPRSRNESMSAHTPRKNVESIHFNLPVKSKSNKTSLSPKNIPHHKIVAGTHFAVDAFSYGEIPNVKHYFLTHFHSDHYSGLKKSFSKLLFCSKITADLCISRLGVNPKNIRVINIDEVIRIEGVEVAAVDANHCPGALMLVFTLPNGKTLLHTGDFRACPQMESYPVFWNKDIHTVYLDTTYCNPRYDFPTQDQSLEAALYILRQKKMSLEKAGKKFSSVLIVCGTYTIGKEKFFMGMSRRVGCSVWACPEKERVLQTVEGRGFTRDKPDACQLHVVPMRDLTHEKLRSYLDSLQGAFAEVVAFKPSGWENGKNSSIEKDCVTIHGIPYSEHSSFSELIRFIKFLKPKQVLPTVDISGGIKSVQKYFPCPLVYKDEFHCQTKVTDYFSIHNRQQVPAVT